MPITLPDLQTPAGALTHLLLAESRGPGNSSYDATAAALGMRAIRATVANRLGFHPEWFNASGAKTWTDIIVAPGQFQGFSKNAAGNVTLSTAVSARIIDALQHANADGAGNPYAAFVQLAVSTAQAATVVDPFAGVTNVGSVATRGGAFGFVTAGTASPGGSFVAIPADKSGVIAGNQFYTIKA